MILSIIGATGATGRAILKCLSKYCAEKSAKDSIFTITRSALLEKFDNVNSIILDDFSQLASLQIEHLSHIDVAICALGTTRAKSGSEGFIKVDHDYVVAFAELTRKKGCDEFHLISASNADPESWFLYPKTKGRAELDLQKLGFKRIYVYRPSLLLTARNESRPFEKIAQIAANYLDYYNSMSVPVEDLAEAVLIKINESKSDSDHVEIISHSNILHLARKGHT